MYLLKKILKYTIDLSMKFIKLMFDIPTFIVKNFLYIIWRIITFPFRIIAVIWRYSVFIFAIFFSSSQKSSKAGARFLLVVLIATVSLGTWAGTSEFDRVITAQAKVISSDNLQTIQHFEGGIVKNIHVKTGEFVRKGVPLISLEPLEAEATYEAKKSEFIQSLIRVRRLDAEYRGDPPEYGSDLQEVAQSQINNELLLLKARRARLRATLDSFDAQIRQKSSELEGASRTLLLVRQEREVILTLVEKGLEPNLEAVRAEKSLAEALSKVNTINAAIEEIKERRAIAIQEHNAEILQELAEANLELSKLEKAVSVAADKSDRSIIRSPVDGVVNRVLVSTIGGVLKTGEPAVEIVPDSNQLLYEAKVTPMDIGYVEIGQAALVKLSTYDFSIYGNLEGIVEIIGSDALEEQNEESHYIVKIKPTSNITSTGRTLQIIPGMTAQIDIKTGKRTVLSYISSPITKTMTTAFKEK